MPKATDTEILIGRLECHWYDREGTLGDPPWKVTVNVTGMETVPRQVTFDYATEMFRATFSAMGSPDWLATDALPSLADYWVTPLALVVGPDDEADQGAVEREHEAMRTLEEEHGDQSRLSGDDA